MPTGVYPRIKKHLELLAKARAKIIRKPWSEETKEKIRQGNLGKKHSKETKQKISKNNARYFLGKHRSEETKGKISKAKKGIEFSEKHKENLSKALKGRTTWNKGKKWAEGQREKCSGKNTTSWKGGVTPENKKIRKSIEFRLWREAVFARDNWTCQKYKIKGGKLHPHHIQNFADYPELRFAIDNGITLSEKAHREFHKKYGQRKNTKEQLEEFLWKN